jgi:two-component system, chemotaxis family, chemotaxis protein CheY
MAKKDISVLIVDDSVHVRTLLSVLMKKEGIVKVQQAVDGDAAVVAFTEMKPTIVFLDYMLPKLSGMEVLKKIRAMDPNVKIVMMSAVSTPSIVQQAKENGASYYLIKPYSNEKLLEVMYHLLGEKGDSA